MKKRREMMEESASSDDEDSSKSYDEEETNKVSKKRQNSMDSGSDKQSLKKSRRMSRSSSSSADSSDSISDKGEESMRRSPSSKQHPTDGNKSDLEEGQISSEDDSNSSSSNSEFDDGYGVDLMGNENDRNYLEKLSEKERETELFKRAERRDQLKRRWEIERKLKQTRRVENAKNKRLKKPKKQKAAPKKILEKTQKPATSSAIEEIHAAAAQTPHLIGPSNEHTFDNAEEYRDEYFDPKERSKERKKNVEMNKTDDKRSNAMAMLKARREGKQKREVEQAAKQQVEDEKEELEGVAEKSSTKLKARDIYSDDSDSDSEEKASNDGRRSPSSPSSGSNSDGESQKPLYKKPVFITSLEEMNKLIIKRYMLEKFISLPIFEKTIVGGFVRVNIGNNMETQQIVYRVAEIQAVVETAKIYQFGKMRTNKGLRLKIGSQERNIRLEFVSNASFTESEFNKWVELCAKADVNLPNVDLIEQKKEDIQAAFNYEFKEEDIDRIIEEKNRFRAYPTNYAMRKTQLMKVC